MLLPLLTDLLVGDTEPPLALKVIVTLVAANGVISSSFIKELVFNSSDTLLSESTTLTFSAFTPIVCYRLSTKNIYIP